MPIKLVVNCETGEVTEVELTPEEIVQREADALVYAQAESEREAEAIAKAEAKASAVAKLSALGLTAEEVNALLG